MAGIVAEVTPTDASKAYVSPPVYLKRKVCEEDVSCSELDEGEVREEESQLPPWAEVREEESQLPPWAEVVEVSPKVRRPHSFISENHVRIPSDASGINRSFTQD